MQIHCSNLLSHELALRYSEWLQTFYPPYCSLVVSSCPFSLDLYILLQLVQGMHLVGLWELALFKKQRSPLYCVVWKTFQSSSPVKADFQTNHKSFQ